MNTHLYPKRLVPALLPLAALLLMGGAARAQNADALSGAAPPDHAVWLDTLDLSRMTQGYGDPGARTSVGGHPLTLGGVVYPHGVGTHAPSDFRVGLHGDATHFGAVVGADDEVKGTVGAVVFSVLADGKVVAQTPVLHGGDPAHLLSVNLAGVKTLELKVLPGGDGITSDHADWAGAEITLADGATTPPTASVPPVVPGRLVVPPPDPHPAIHGARLTGATPGHPFLFLIPATGAGPLTYAATPLPAGLHLDAHTGIISGSLTQSGRSVVRLTVRGPQGVARRDLIIVGGDHPLALTPPMGWNSWNVWGTQVSDVRVRAAADEMAASGLAGHGFAYINIDDGWEAGRDAQGNIQANGKFPDMKATADYVHGKGLRFGIYSSPGPKTCGGYTASYQHEAQDAATYAAWGVDYLKYDWCSYEQAVAHGDRLLPALQKPYLAMHDDLSRVNRDILFSLCQYGMGDVWTWGASVGGNTWRTGSDIQDNWRSLHGIYEGEAGRNRYAGPGHWNDPDMLMVGMVGFGHPHPNLLTQDEQITHISLWCLLSAPLLVGCDMTKLDPFTLGLLSNDEALDIDQDPLGRPADRVAQAGDDAEVWARPLFDGAHAIGLVNGGDSPQTVTARWADCGITGTQPVRDLWLHKNVGSYAGSYSVLVPAHGTVLLRVGKPSQP